MDSPVSSPESTEVQADARPERVKDAPSPPAPKSPSRLDEALSRTVALGAATEEYVRAQAGAIRVAVDETTQRVLRRLGVLGVCVAGAIIGLVHLSQGLKVGLETALGGRLWLAHLLTGLLGIALVSIIAILLERREAHTNLKRYLSMRSLRREFERRFGDSGPDVAECLAYNEQEHALRESLLARRRLRHGLERLRARLAEAARPAAFLRRHPALSLTLVVGILSAVEKRVRRASLQWQALVQRASKRVDCTPPTGNRTGPGASPADRDRAPSGLMERLGALLGSAVGPASRALLAMIVAEAVQWSGRSLATRRTTGSKAGGHSRTPASNGRASAARRRRKPARTSRTTRGRST